MTIQVGQSAPEFSANAVVDGEFARVKLSDYKGKKVVLFFYPLDFTFVCPTEIVAFQDKLGEFQDRNTQVLGCSIDSRNSHHAWLQVPRNQGGIQGVTYPLVSDITKDIGRNYGVLMENAGICLRGTFIIDEEGIIKHMSVNHNDLGRNVDEILRLIDALAFSQEHGEVCPANWHKGDKTIKANPKDSKEFFATVSN